MATNQLRAKAGGEYGVNGEFYEGGKFIATSPDTIKQAPIHLDRPVETEAYAALRAQWAANAAAHESWIAGRAAKFADTLAVLLSKVEGQIFETFENSLGRQLRDEGTLSRKQAACVVRVMFGRRNKANGDAYDFLFESLQERWQV